MNLAGIPSQLAGSDNIKIQYDIYHMQRIANHDGIKIGHLQIADNPRRYGLHATTVLKRRINCEPESLLYKVKNGMT